MMSYNQSSLPHCLLLPCSPIPPQGWTSPATHLLRFWTGPVTPLIRVCVCVPGSLDFLCLPLALHCLLTPSQKVMWRRSGSNKPAAPSLINPAWETRGCAPRSFCGAGMVQAVPRRCAPSPHAASEGALLPLEHQGEDDSKTRCPSFLLDFVPTQLALVLSVSCSLGSPCLFIVSFGASVPWNARIWVWTQNTVTASPTRYWYGHGPLTAVSTGRGKQMSV